MTGRTRHLVVAALLLTANASARLPAYGQATCTPAEPLEASGQGVLARRITLHATGVTVAEALQRLAESAHLRFSYSADAIPPRRVCLAWTAVPVGDALSGLLRGTGLEPIVMGSDHIVLAPARTRPQPAARLHADTLPVVPLDEVRVVIQPNTAAHRSATVHAVIIDAEQLAQRGSTTLADALNGAVPGLWLWSDGSGSSLTTYGSMRGASSFRATSPKLYIDGIEVANSQLLTRIAPATIERIEVIRGPQGAALYGANALGGVVNIVTRRYADGGSALQYVQSRLGWTTSDFATGRTLSQEHAISALGGSGGRTAGVNVSIGSYGDYAPGAGTQHVAADAFGRITGAHSIVTATARFLGERSGTATSPLLPDSVLGRGTRRGAAGWVGDLPSMQQYTAGLTGAFTAGRWTHTIIAGVDGYRLDEADLSEPALPFAGSALVTDLFANALRASVRASSVRDVAGPRLTGTLTVAAEHTLLRQSGSVRALPAYTPVARDGAAGGEPAAEANNGADAGPVVSRTTGFSAQSELLWSDHLLLTGGLRLERNGTPFELIGRWAALPMFGAAILTGFEGVGLKLRTAYGRAIRWPDLAPASPWLDRDLQRLLQTPEEQSGIELGLDARFGASAALHVTHFDQIATGVIHQQGVPQPTPRTRQGNGTAPAPSTGTMWPGTPVQRGGGYPYAQSLGAIHNRGWEMEGSLKHGRLGLNGSLTLVDSRVQRLAGTYTGELRPGDRMLAVPARIASLSASWTDIAWAASLTAARASDWVSYDQLGLLTRLATTSLAALSTAELRSFWRSYDGHVHVNASASRRLSDRLTLTLSGANLLGVQVGEPDNVTVVPGRTLSVGVRASF